MSLWSWLAKRYPGLKFVYEYSPKTAERREILRKIMNFVAKNDLGGGAYLEFGVYKGGTFIESYKVARAKKLDRMKFFAFDSFEGLPESIGLDKEFHQFATGEYKFSLENFKERLIKNGISNVEIVSGWFDKTLNADTKKRLGIKSAAVVWIDCDLYESTVPVLKFIKDYIIDGTIIVFDDWYHFRGNPKYGEQRAFREWLAENPQFTASEFHKYFWHGNSFIIHKN